MKYYIYPYKQSSQSAKALKEALGGKFIKAVGSVVKPGPDNVIINWGAVNFPAELKGANTFNENVSVCANKKKTLEALLAAGVSCPPFTTDKAKVRDWLDDGSIVFARTLLSSSNGKGIVILREEDQIPDAPLYTRYMKKQQEFRVHVMDAKPFYLQQKLRKNGEDNHLIRNCENGYVYTSKDVVLPGVAADLACQAVNALGLDFGAVDLIYNNKKDTCYVLEVNSAPGIENNSVAAYKQAILDAIG